VGKARDGFTAYFAVGRGFELPRRRCCCRRLEIWFRDPRRASGEGMDDRPDRAPNWIFRLTYNKLAELSDCGRLYRPPACKQLVGQMKLRIVFVESRRRGSKFRGPVFRTSWGKVEFIFPLLSCSRLGNAVSRSPPRRLLSCRPRSCLGAIKGRYPSPRDSSQIDHFSRSPLCAGVGVRGQNGDNSAWSARLRV
jgi:hypothetical protein